MSITIRGADLTLGYANDPHPMNGLIIQSSWTDPSPKGFVMFVPGIANVVMGGPLWDQQWIPGRFAEPYVNMVSVSVIHITPAGDHHLLGFVKEPDPASCVYPNAEGINLAIVQGAVGTGAIYSNAQFFLNDAPRNAGNPAHCCAPQDRELSRYVGACKSRRAPPRGFLPGYVQTPPAPNDCFHWRTRPASVRHARSPRARRP